MKQSITSYTFNAAAKTVTLSGWTTVVLERLYLIINVTDQVIIYNPADSAKGATAATNVFTLEHDTTSMDNTDDLLIIYDSDTSDPIYTAPSPNPAIDVNISFTRPSDTTAYASGDSVADSTSAPTEFTASGFARVAAGSGRIERIILTMSTAAATKANLELWIFDALYTNINDNTAFSLSDADSNLLIAIVPLGGSPISAVNNVIYQAEVDIPFVCGASSTALWCALVVRNAYTPASAEVFNIRFLGVQLN